VVRLRAAAHEKRPRTALQQLAIGEFARGVGPKVGFCLKTSENGLNVHFAGNRYQSEYNELPLSF
jgi:hypothetical protein